MTIVANLSKLSPNYGAFLMVFFNDFGEDAAGTEA